MNAERIATENTILRCTVGSTLHGLALEGTDDSDEMGICIEPPNTLIGLDHFEQYIYRTQPEGARSGPGDLDLTIYSLRKYCRLAANGNPTILLPLFAPPENILEITQPGQELRDIRHAFISLRAGEAHLGYLTAQKQRLLGERGQKRTKRPELVDQHGYDTKYAMHMLRLGLQGVEILQTGQITLPMPPESRQELMRVRRGEHNLQHVTSWSGQLEQQMQDLLNGASPLPPTADRELINDYLIAAHLRHWQ